MCQGFARIVAPLICPTDFAGPRTIAGPEPNRPRPVPLMAARLMVAAVVVSSVLCWAFEFPTSSVRLARRPLAFSKLLPGTTAAEVEAEGEFCRAAWFVTWAPIAFLTISPSGTGLMLGLVNAFSGPSLSGGGPA